MYLENGSIRHKMFINSEVSKYILLLNNCHKLALHDEILIPKFVFLLTTDDICQHEITS